MKLDKIRQFLKTLNSEVDDYSDAWAKARCPLAPWTHEHGSDSKPSFGITITGGDSFYNCFSCSSSGDLPDLVHKIRHHKAKDDKFGYDIVAASLILTNNEHVQVPDEAGFIEVDYSKPVCRKVTPFASNFLDKFLSARGHPYLTKRGISREVSDELGLLFDVQQQRICFPVYSSAGLLMGLHGRDVTGRSSLPYLVYKDDEVSNLIVWYGEHWCDFDKPVVLTESVFDLAKIYHVYKNVMCSLSASLSKPKIERLNTGTEFITFYDNGKAADTARDKLERYLNGHVFHIVPSAEEGDAGAMDIAEIKHAIDFALQEV